MGPDLGAAVGVGGRWRRLDSLGVCRGVGDCWSSVGGFWWASIAWVRV